MFRACWGSVLAPLRAVARPLLGSAIAASRCWQDGDSLQAQVHHQCTTAPNDHIKASDLCFSAIHLLLCISTTTATVSRCSWTTVLQRCARGRGITGPPRRVARVYKTVFHAVVPPRVPSTYHGTLVNCHNSSVLRCRNPSCVTHQNCIMSILHFFLTMICSALHGLGMHIPAA